VKKLLDGVVPFLLPRFSSSDNAGLRVRRQTIQSSYGPSTVSAGGEKVKKPRSLHSAAKSGSGQDDKVG